MLATAQSGSDFQTINERAQQAVQAVFIDVSISSRVVVLEATPAAEFRAMPKDVVGVIEEGLVSVLYNNTVVSVLEPGDLLLSDMDYLPLDIDALI